ncbi:MAG: hypothetical protein N3F67_00105 [Acidilobaceae archaeon]|nr:hypothetical protein [Acidilobaceae archaeon]
MGFDILLTGSAIFTGERVLRKGYVYVKDGKVEGVGEDVVPEEYTYATLLLGGEGRIIVPGLSALASIAAYPMRFKKPTMAERVRFYKSSDLKTLITASLPAVYELHMSGVTLIVAEGIGVELPLELSRLVGGFYGLAVPACSGVRPNYVPGIAAIVSIAGEGCEGEGEIKEIDGKGRSSAGPVLSFFNSVSYSAGSSPSPWEESLALRKFLSLPPPAIKPGRVAEIAVFDASRPPAMLLDLASDEEIVKVYNSGARLESLIAGEDVLVDTGEHLYIAEKQFREARSLAEKLRK